MQIDDFPKKQQPGPSSISDPIKTSRYFCV